MITYLRNKTGGGSGGGVFVEVGNATYLEWMDMYMFSPNAPPVRNQYNVNTYSPVRTLNLNSGDPYPSVGWFEQGPHFFYNNTAYNPVADRVDMGGYTGNGYAPGVAGVYKFEVNANITTAGNGYNTATYVEPKIYYPGGYWHYTNVTNWTFQGYNPRVHEDDVFKFICVKGKVTWDKTTAQIISAWSSTLNKQVDLDFYGYNNPAQWFEWNIHDTAESKSGHMFYGADHLGETAFTVSFIDTITLAADEMVSWWCLARNDTVDSYLHTNGSRADYRIYRIRSGNVKIYQQQ